MAMRSRSAALMASTPFWSSDCKSGSSEASQKDFSTGAGISYDETHRWRQRRRSAWPTSPSVSSSLGEAWRALPPASFEFALLLAIRTANQMKRTCATLLLLSLCFQSLLLLLLFFSATRFLLFFLRVIAFFILFLLLWRFAPSQAFLCRQPRADPSDTPSLRSLGASCCYFSSKTQF